MRRWLRAWTPNLGEKGPKRKRGMPWWYDQCVTINFSGDSFFKNNPEILGREKVNKTDRLVILLDPRGKIDGPLHRPVPRLRRDADENQSSLHDLRKRKVKVVGAMLSFVSPLRKKVEGFNGKAVPVGRIDVIVVRRKMRYLNEDTATGLENPVAVLQQGDVINVFEDVEAENFRERAVLEGKGQCVEVMNDIHAVQTEKVEVHVAGPDVVPAA